MASKIYPSELKLNMIKHRSLVLGFHLSVSNDIVSTKLYNKLDDFDFEIVNFQFLDGSVPRSTSYGVIFINSSNLLSIHVPDFNTCNKLLTEKLLKQGYMYHILFFLNLIADTMI